VRSILPFALALWLCGSAATAQQVAIGPGSVVETVQHLQAGQFVWAPQVAPAGPLLMIVNLKRNGLCCSATAFRSPRRPSRPAVPAVRPRPASSPFCKNRSFIIRTSTITRPCPYMERLTWGGVALHAGNLPGYPASHGCIRLPAGFAQRLYGVTRLGMTVVITDHDLTPRIAPDPQLTDTGADASTGPIEWHPERSPSGPLSVVVSSADKRALVLRNGVIIGSGPVSVDGSVAGTWAYTLHSIDAAGQHWIRIQLDSESSAIEVPKQEWQRFRAPEEFRKDVASIVAPGATWSPRIRSRHPLPGRQSPCWRMPANSPADCFAMCRIRGLLDSRPPV